MFNTTQLKYSVIVLFTVIVSILGEGLFAQNSLKEILHSSNDFAIITKKADTYFTEKHPNKSFLELTQGTHRDGEFVKYMRWKSFWQKRLTQDGQLGTLEVQSTVGSKSRNRSQNVYDQIEWNNISHRNYIVGQIGLGRTTSVGFHPTNSSTFYVGAAMGGIWKTEDGGQSYIPLGDDLPYLAVSSILVHPNRPSTIYIAVSDHVWYGPGGIGVYQSNDEGLTWEPTALTFDLAQDIRIYEMAISPDNPDLIFVATQDGLYKTTDGFSTVEKVNNIQTNSIRFKPNDSSILYQGGLNGEFLKSTNGGNTFNLLRDVGNSGVLIAVSQSDPERVYIRYDNKMLKSYNSGNSFENRSYFLPENNTVFIFAPNDPDVMIVGNIEIFRSDNDADSFYPISNWLGENNLPLIHVDQRNMFANPLEPNYIYICNDGGLFRYSISSNQFEDLSNGLAITQFYDIAVAQTNTSVIGGGSQDNGNIFRDIDRVWKEYAPTGDGMTQAIDPTDHEIRYWTYQLGGMQRWYQGVNTDIAPFGNGGRGAWETPFRLDPNNPSRIIAGYLNVYESLDRGDSWSQISPVLDASNLQHVAIAPSNSNRIYAAGTRNLYVKNINGTAWATKTIPGINFITDIEVDPFDMNTIYVSNGSIGERNKVFKSTDAGSSWTDISDNLPNYSIGAIEMYKERPGGIFVGTNTGVFYRDNSLANWVEIGTLPHTMVEDIEINYSGNLLRVGTYGRGIFEASLTTIVCAEGASDSDNDGVCDEYDNCPNFDDSLIGQPCEEREDGSVSKYYTDSCTCEENIVYCSAEGTEGTTADWIRNVQVNTLNNLSDKTAYSDFTNITTSLKKDSSYLLNVQLNESFDLDRIYAWLDYNVDGNFDENERIIMSSIETVNNSSSGTIIIPETAEAGLTRLRVRVIFGDQVPADPCGSYFGEVEDYTIEIVESDEESIVYCSAEGTEGTTVDWIRNVQVNTLNNLSDKTAYSDFTNITTSLKKDSSYLLNVQLNQFFDLDRIYAWLDYNVDGNFDENERIIMSSIETVNNSSSGTIIIPETAEAGLTRLRVRVIYGDQVPADPCGSYFGEVEDYTIEIVEPNKDRIQAKVYLEGFLDTLTNKLSETLKNKGLLPLQQPYSSAPWYYMGTESVTSLPNNVVDWVLVATRTPAGEIIEQTAGFVNNEGFLVDLQGNMGIPVTNNQTYFSIHHRSHIAVMSNKPYENELYNFTVAPSQAAGFSQLKSYNGLLVMYSGDYDGNGIINNLDYNNWTNKSAELNIYDSVDGDGNGIINSLDYNLWRRNQSKIGHDPLQY